MSVLNGLDWKIVIHNDEQFNKYKGNPTIPQERLLISGTPLGIQHQRQWILDNCIEKGDWFVMMDDNIKGINKFPEPYYQTETFDKNNKAFRIPFEGNYLSEPDELVKLIMETISKAEKIGANFCGFATIENFFFRSKKWKTVSMICSKFCLVKKTELCYDNDINTMDDYAFSAKHLVRDGKVLVNAYVWPKAVHNQIGGLGLLKERADKKIADCKRLMEKFPGLFRYKARKNSVEGGEIVLRFYNQESVKKWKNSLHL